ncbi:DUF2818 family protein [Diaphorobacter aerolatus]|uniref:DUF2818 family protein n=1 Tax=Diaphorobacter aerolatus TaxID=1288495 RepID=A0A7H0GIF5_9BURK|nr:DUF2818 family protein [Diaphorobacter aerolatus]QNP48071.1 DUF2818 family protein [Diaphorobacter aerolatus]
MSQTAAIWLVILAAFAAANWPFLSQRLMLVGPLPKGAKPFAVRLLELVVLYLVVGLIAMLLERRAGQNAPQGWEFYAVTATLFITLAFPGFVYRYLVRRRG